MAVSLGFVGSVIAMISLRFLVKPEQWNDDDKCKK